MARDHIGECWIGELTIAVGVSILFPSASVLWDLADDYMNRPFWAGIIILCGFLLAWACNRGTLTQKIALLCAAAFVWLSLLACYIVTAQATPMAFICVVVMMRILQRLRWAWKG